MPMITTDSTTVNLFPMGILGPRAFDDTLGVSPLRVSAPVGKGNYWSRFAESEGAAAGFPAKTFRPGRFLPASSCAPRTGGLPIAQTRAPPA
jgi:hypothetical protein